MENQICGKCLDFSLSHIVEKLFGLLRVKEKQAFHPIFPTFFRFIIVVCEMF
jgi:hypothetical protein